MPRSTGVSASFRDHDHDPLPRTPRIAARTRKAPVSEALTSGSPALDGVIDGVRIGDNLVVRSTDRTVLAEVADRFVAQRGSRALVVCTVGEPWVDRADLPDDVEVLDLRDPTGTVDLEAARAAVAAADERVGGDALFVFWTLSAVEDLAGPDTALRLFLWACPQLYRRRSVALWPLDPARHEPAMMRRLESSTQVVVDVVVDTEHVALQVVRADGRPSTTVGRRWRVSHDLGQTLSTTAGSRDTLGELIRRERAERRVSQADLARRVGISPSALSQLERGVRSVSADTITRIWEALEVPFGPSGQTSSGHRVARRGANEPPDEAAAGMSRWRLAEHAQVADIWRVRITPHAAGRGTPFAVKSPEALTVLSGVVGIDIDGQTVTLHEGDTVTITTSVVTGWANPGDAPAELLWILLPSSP